MAQAVLSGIAVFINSKGRIEIEQSKVDIAAFRSLLDAHEVENANELCDALLHVQYMLADVYSTTLDRYKALT